MQEWIKISYLLCIYGFLRELRPSDPYFFEFMAERNNAEKERAISEKSLTRDVLPIVTYSHLAQLVVVFLVTDYFRYKSMILITTFAGVLTYGIILWTNTLLCMQVAHFFYGSFNAGEIAYYTYIYAKMEKEHYSMVTAYSRAAMLTGKFVACIGAQTAVRFTDITYRVLTIITFAGQICATLWVLRLPRARKSLYFHRHLSILYPETYPQPEAASKYDEAANERFSALSASEFHAVSPAKLIWLHFKESYTNKQVVLWSIFYATGICGYLQVLSYVQALWRSIEPSTKMPWNAGVDGVLRFLGALASYLAGYIQSTGYNPRTFLAFVAMLTIMQGCAIILSCVTTDILVSYSAYIFYGIIHCFHITIASVEVAKNLQTESFALIFGINTFFALVMQTIFTVLVVADFGFRLSVVNQYLITGIYYITIGIGYFLFDIIDCCRSR